MRSLLIVAASALALTGCTTFSWSDPCSGVVVRYSSMKDLDASGVLIEVEVHYPDGCLKKLIHLEFGAVTAKASTVIEAAAPLVESAIKGAVEGAKIGAGIP